MKCSILTCWNCDEKKYWREDREVINIGFPVDRFLSFSLLWSPLNPWYWKCLVVTPSVCQYCLILTQKKEKYYLLVTLWKCQFCLIWTMKRPVLFSSNSLKESVGSFSGCIWVRKGGGGGGRGDMYHLDNSIMYLTTYLCWEW